VISAHARAAAGPRLQSQIGERDTCCDCSWSQGRRGCAGRTIANSDDGSRTFWKSICAQLRDPLDWRVFKERVGGLARQELSAGCAGFACAAQGFPAPVHEPGYVGFAAVVIYASTGAPGIVRAREGTGSRPIAIEAAPGCVEGCAGNASGNKSLSAHLGSGRDNARSARHSALIDPKHQV